MCNRPPPCTAFEGGQQGSSLVTSGNFNLKGQDSRNSHLKDKLNVFLGPLMFNIQGELVLNLIASPFHGYLAPIKGFKTGRWQRFLKCLMRKHTKHMFLYY